MSVSIIIPTYNRGYVLGEAINSALSQTYKDIEVIVCDDCSTDNTEEVVKSFNDERITYHRNEVNLGLPENRNVGISLSRYRWIIMWEDDITYRPDGVRILVETAENLERRCIKVGAVSPMTFEDVKSGKLLSLETMVANNMRGKLSKPSYVSKWTGLMFNNMKQPQDYITETDLVNPWSLFNKAAIKSVGGYSPWFGKFVGYSHEETDLMVRLNKAGYGLYYDSQSVAHHKRTLSGGTRVKQSKYAWNYVSAHVLFLMKDYTWRSVYMIPCCFLYVGFNAVKYLPQMVKE